MEPTLQAMYDYDHVFQDKRRNLKAIVLLPALAGISIINDKIYQDGIELTPTRRQEIQQVFKEFGFYLANESNLEASSYPAVTSARDYCFMLTEPKVQSQSPIQEVSVSSSNPTPLSRAKLIAENPVHVNTIAKLPK